MRHETWPAMYGKVRPLSQSFVMCSRQFPAPHRLWSPSDLALFAESPWAAWLERLTREEPSHRLAASFDPPDAFSDLLGRKGIEAEVELLRRSCRMGRRVIDLSALTGTRNSKVEATVCAMAEKPDIIYQAPLQGEASTAWQTSSFASRKLTRSTRCSTWSGIPSSAAVRDPRSCCNCAATRICLRACRVSHLSGQVLFWAASSPSHCAWTPSPRYTATFAAAFSSSKRVLTLT